MWSGSRAAFACDAGLARGAWGRFSKPPAGIAYSDHQGGDGEAFRRAACKHGFEGVVSKRLDRPYLPGDRGARVKSKCLNRAEFVIVAAARLLRA